ncbi:MAG: DUF6460 domain-containing protein [Xanthobacteraceae bacterium]
MAQSSSPVSRFFGGPPLAVLFRLVLLSVLVGVILKVMGLDPFNILRSIEDLFRAIWNMGFDAIDWLWRYFLLGAVIVIPIWLLVRLIRAPQGR